MTGHNFRSLEAAMKLFKCCAPSFQGVGTPPMDTEVGGRWVSVSFTCGQPKLSCELDRENILSSQAVFAFTVADSGWVSEGFLLHCLLGPTLQLQQSQAAPQAGTECL